MTEKIRRILVEKLGAEYVQILDESEKHAGHAGRKLGGGHFQAVIVSKAFEGLSLVKRHRKVYEVLGNLMNGEIHALSMKTFTPGEWMRAKVQTG